MNLLKFPEIDPIDTRARSLTKSLIEKDAFLEALAVLVDYYNSIEMTDTEVNVHYHLTSAFEWAKYCAEYCITEDDES